MPPVVLVVDDSMLIRHSVCRLLQEQGFAVEAVSNGLEALEKLAVVKPALIVTDIQMPKMGGSELITALKKNPETAQIPIIIVAGRQSGFEYTENRANFTIFKDIDVDEQLKKAIAAIFRKAAASSQ